MEALPDGGVIEVSTKKVDQNVVLEVVDNGLGVAPEDLPRIFDVSWTTKGASGTGMGLAVSKEIIHRHGGKIKVRTRPAGELFFP